MIAFLGRFFISLLRCFSDETLRRLARILFSRSWRQFQHAVEHPEQVQFERLVLILERAKDTVFGREHRFAEINTIEDFRRQVPIRKYDHYEPYIDRMIAGEENILLSDVPHFFARSSGTTGAPKYIPITEAYLTEFRRPRRVWMRQVMQVFPGLLRGKILSVHSPKIEGHTEGGHPFGSITAAMSGTKESSDVPVDFLGMEAVPRCVFLIEDFQTKYYVILRFAAQARISLAAAINPSTLVLLAEKLHEFAERLAADLETGQLDCLDQLEDSIAAQVREKLRAAPAAARRIRKALADGQRILPTELWPQLQGLLCWKGGSAPFYLKQLHALYPRQRMMDFGYLASEGGFSIVMGAEGSKGVVAVAGHFLEFLPMAKDGEVDWSAPLLAHELTKECDYRIVITGSHGLYRYDINDVVRCVGFYKNTAEIEFVHKGGNMLSVTGEKLGESHVVSAVAAISENALPKIVGFSVSVELISPPRYVFALEFERSIESGLAQLALHSLERALGDVNIEYAAKRESLRLGPPCLWLLRTGAFERDRARRVANGAPENHVKPRHLVKTIQDLEDLGVEFKTEFEG